MVGRLSANHGNAAKRFSTRGGAGNGPGKAELLNELDQRLNLEDVKTLLFELGIDYDDLAGDTKKGKLREMLLYMERQGQMPRLVSHLRDNYPNVLSD